MNQVIRTIFLSVLLVVASSAMAGEGLKETIQARNDAWSAAFNAGDAAALAALYEESAVLAAPGGPPVHGNAAIGEAFSGLFGVLLDINLTTVEVRPAGKGHVVEIGRANYDMAGPDGALYAVTSNYVVSWRQGEDGIWRLDVDIFNEQGRETKAE